MKWFKSKTIFALCGEKIPGLLSQGMCAIIKDNIKTPQSYGDDPTLKFKLHLDSAPDVGFEFWVALCEARSWAW